MHIPYIFVHSSVDGHLSCSNILAIINMRVWVSLWRLLDYTIILLWIFWGVLILCFMMAVPFCIHTRIHQCARIPVSPHSPLHLSSFYFFYFLTMCVVSCSVMSHSLQPHGIVAHQAPLSMGFSRQEYWSGLSCLPLGDLPNPGIEPRSPALQTDSLPSEPPSWWMWSEILFWFGFGIHNS